MFSDVDGEDTESDVRSSGDGDETEEEEDEDEVKENTNPPSDPNRPSLKVMFIQSLLILLSWPLDGPCTHGIIQ